MSRPLVIAGAALLLAVMALELAFAARQQSPTFDEAVHIYSGYRYWKNSDFGADPEVPPLVKRLAALPLLGMRLRAPAALPDADFKMVDYAAGRDFLYGNDASEILWRSRMAAAILTLALGAAVFCVTWSIWGAGAALLALALLAFEPNFLAHGALVTTDVGVTLGIFLGVFAYYFYSRRPSTGRLVLAGLAAGACLGMKHSGILLFPMLVLLALSEWLPAKQMSGDAPEQSEKRASQIALRQAGSLVLVGLVAVAMLWSFYGFRFAARPAGLHVTPALPEFAKTISAAPAFLVLHAANWRLLPESYLYGVVDILSSGSIPTVIFGKYYPSAQWFYFPSVFVVKCTLAFLVLCALAPFGLALLGRPFRREWFFLVVPPAFYLAVAMSSRMNYGIRHLLPIFPFLIILAAASAWRIAQRHRALAVLIAILLAAHSASSARAYPNYIPYANELWGGPARTHEILADSNVDWGQGLVAMKRYIDKRQIRNCWFAYFGSLIVDVSYYGIPCKPLPTAFSDLVQISTPAVPAQSDGPVFLSATEVTRTFWRADWINPYSAFQKARPSALIADSILVFDAPVDLSEVSALTHEERTERLVRDQKFDDALREADAAVKAAPGRPIAHVTRGNVLSALGRREEALAEMNKANSAARAILARE